MSQSDNKDSGSDNYVARTGEFAISKRNIAVNAAEFNQGLSSEDDGARIPVDPNYYPEPVDFQAEMKRARPVFEQYRDAARQMINDVRVGRPLVLAGMEAPLKAMLESVVRHPDPMVWMTQLLIPQSFLTGHLIRTSVLSAVLARGMGLPQNQLARAAWGGLLCQLGKAKLPRKLLESPGPLAPDELEKIRGFVQLGVEMLEALGGVDRDVIEIVRFHHERHDGSGYPAGVSGAQIPVLARLVGLVDWYDTMTSRKPYSEIVISSTQAVDLLNSKRNVTFADQVIEEFIKVIGLYPNGSLVLLQSGEVGLVQAQNHNNRTQPVILLVLDARQKPLSPYRHLDLLSYNKNSPDDPKVITRALPDGEFGLDPAAIMERAAARKRGWRRFLPGS